MMNGVEIEKKKKKKKKKGGKDKKRLKILKEEKKKRKKVKGENVGLAFFDHLMGSGNEDEEDKEEQRDEEQDNQQIMDAVEQVVNRSANQKKRRREWVEPNLKSKKVRFDDDTADDVEGEEMEKELKDLSKIDEEIARLEAELNDESCCSESSSDSDLEEIPPLPSHLLPQLKKSGAKIKSKSGAKVKTCGLCPEFECFSKEDMAKHKQSMLHLERGFCKVCNVQLYDKFQVDQHRGSKMHKLKSEGVKVVKRKNLKKNGFGRKR